ncbi:MAG: DUF58 domain-containing protein [Deltaproteobacteria bacterium]|nr:DUF58 domain-containing protein [Deltaproteobacteria bacterium]
MPTRRAALLLLLGALPALAAIARPGLWLAVAGFDLLVLAALLADALRAPRPGSVLAERLLREPLAAFLENPVVLRLRSRLAVPVALEVADAPPATFASEQHRTRLALAAGGSAAHAYAVHPRERGRHAFGDLHLRAAGPWGLWARQWRVALAREVLVYPDLRARAGAAAPGAAAPGSAVRGGFAEGREFESLRSYVPGDDVRTVDWKATARRGAPVVRELRPERDQTLWLLLDCGRQLAARLADGRTKLDAAVDAALALARAAVDRGDRVGCLLLGAELGSVLAPARGRGQLGALAEALAGARARPEEPDWAVAFDALQARQSRRALVVVFTDLADPDQSALLLARTAALRRRHLPWVVAVADSALADAARAEPASEAEAYARLAAERILAERDLAAARLQAAGVRVLSVPARELAGRVVSGYLELKARGRL